MAKNKKPKLSPGAALVAQRYAKMTPKERSAAARNAAVKRWAKEKDPEHAVSAAAKTLGSRGGKARAKR